MVAAVVRRKYLSRVAGIANRLVKIEHAIEFAAMLDPLVYLLANRFFFRRVELIEGGRAKERMFKRRDRSSNCKDTFLMRFGNQLTITGDDCR